jgi:hypothetical protein
MTNDRVVELKRRIAEERARRKNSEVIILPEDELTGVPLFVYNLIRFGAIDGRNRELWGATDPEIVQSIAQRIPTMPQSTIRYIRWNLEKQGYIQKTDKKRRIDGKGRKSVIFIVADKYRKIYEAIHAQGSPGTQTS